MVIPIKGRDGVSRPFLTRVEPVKDDGGRVVRWFGTNTDISELKRAEEALKQADRRKNEFLALLAHEMRSPLAAIGNALMSSRSWAWPIHGWSRALMSSTASLGCSTGCWTTCWMPRGSARARSP